MASHNFSLDPHLTNRGALRGAHIRVDISRYTTGQSFRVIYRGRVVIEVPYNNGHVTLHSRGYRTKTTKALINRFFRLIDAPYAIGPSSPWVLRNTVRNTSTTFVDDMKVGLSARQHFLLMQQTLTYDDDLLSVFGLME